MAYFAYKGRDPQGRLVEGVLETIDASSTASLLLMQSITPIDIAEQVQAKQLPIKLPAFRAKITALDVMLFSRQMYTLLHAGIPIMNALSGLQSSTENSAFAAVIADLRSKLDSGRELSSALREHPEVFTNFYVNMVKVGETTGKLDQIFLRLFDHIEFERLMRNQIKAALRYPSFVVAAMVIAITIINIFVIPAFSKVFANMHAELPALTKALIWLSKMTIDYSLYISMLAVIAFIGFRHFISTEDGRYRWHRWLLDIPIAGKIIHKGTMARFARSFALATQNGISITPALHLVSITLDNEFIGRKVDEMRMGVERGESILNTAHRAGVFNALVLQMIAVGEESGSLDDLMEEVANMYQRDVEYEIKTLGAQIEPILIVFLGVLVLLLALGIFLPIWDLSKVAMHQ